MKTAGQWAEEIRAALGNSLHYDPILTTGKSLLETLVEKIQEDSIPTQRVFSAPFKTEKE